MGKPAIAIVSQVRKSVSPAELIANFIGELETMADEDFDMFHEAYLKVVENAKVKAQAIAAKWDKRLGSFSVSMAPVPAKQMRVPVRTAPRTGAKPGRPQSDKSREAQEKVYAFFLESERKGINSLTLISISEATGVSYPNTQYFVNKLIDNGDVIKADRARYKLNSISFQNPKNQSSEVTEKKVSIPNSIMNLIETKGRATRQMILGMNLGSENAINLAIMSLKKKGFIKVEAWGVYVKA